MLEGHAQRKGGERHYTQMVVVEGVESWHVAEIRLGEGGIQNKRSRENRQRQGVAAVFSHDMLAEGTGKIVPYRDRREGREGTEGWECVGVWG